MALLLSFHSIPGYRRERNPPQVILVSVLKNRNTNSNRNQGENRYERPSRNGSLLCPRASRSPSCCAISSSCKRAELGAKRRAARGQLCGSWSVSGEQVLLPIWHNISKQEVVAYSPSLADKVARNTATHSVEEIAKEITELIKSKR